jgi:hypothetical protein
MPRLGVPSTTDSARVMADVCGEPAPLPRSTNPRHNDRPGGTFPRVVQPLIKTSEKGRKEGAWRSAQGRKPRVYAAARWRRFRVPRRFLRSNADVPGCTREVIDFSKLHGKNRRPGRDSEVFVDSVTASICPTKSTASGLRSAATKPTRCARPMASARKIPSQQHLLGDHRAASLVGPHGRDPPHPAQSRGPCRANHSLKINRIASNRRELARA